MGRPKSLTNPLGHVTRYECDNLNRLKLGGARTEFLYDGVNPVQEKDGGTVLANILGGLGIDEYLTRSIPADSTATRHFLSDALGRKAERVIA